MKYKIATITYTSWCGLGFIRGINNYKYNQLKFNDTFLYSNSIIYGLFGFIMYANPILLPITIHKEIYRFEINTRNIENEKKSRYYNELI